MNNIFKWAIVGLGILFLIVLADYLVFQPQEQRERELECFQIMDEKVRLMDNYKKRFITGGEAIDAIDLCVKGFMK
ncbi:MAG: hypothetical protein EOL97_14910 [Spirochaetia bacterium]|nr:hypothetical protein [Spirochaetia bacterium]